MLDPIKFIDAANKIEGKLIEIRRTLHANPELAFEEYETSKLAAKSLSEVDIEFISGIAKTGVIGTLKGGLSNENSKCVALRGDMDALPIQELTGLPFQSKNPGKMHACGHDSHTTMLIGAAIILSEFREELSGTVKFIFQPSEELLPGGAGVMMKEGALNGVDAIFGQHVAPFVPAGKLGFYPGMMLASADEIYITIKGKSGHAAMPHTSIDPIITACEVVVALQKIISRTINPFKPGVLTIGKIEGGSATNIIPDEVKLCGTLRAMDEVWRTNTHKRIEDIIKGVCDGNGASYDLEIRLGYPALNNNIESTKFVKSVALEIFGNENVFDAEPMMGAEDFAFYLQAIPGSFWWIGAGTQEEGCIAGLHNSKFDINESILTKGSAMMAYSAYKFLQS
ncbi:MAG: amidohydrolase [Chlorobiota bacterium]|nr:amidohydrolase [Chlorobiota bacterium]QQS66009.1 MAG: amidohydrolase [Chlorobiota bacterium]